MSELRIDRQLFPRAGDHRSGDPCPNCGGYLGIYKSRVKHGLRVRYLSCTTRSCGYRPKDNQHVLPLRGGADQ